MGADKFTTGQPTTPREQLVERITAYAIASKAAMSFDEMGKIADTILEKYDIAPKPEPVSAPAPEQPAASAGTTEVPE